MNLDYQEKFIDPTNQFFGQLTGKVNSYIDSINADVVSSVSQLKESSINLGNSLYEDPFEVMNSVKDNVIQLSSDYYQYTKEIPVNLTSGYHEVMGTLTSSVDGLQSSIEMFVTSPEGIQSFLGDAFQQLNSLAAYILELIIYTPINIIEHGFEHFINMMLNQYFNILSSLIV